MKKNVRYIKVITLWILMVLIIFDPKAAINSVTSSIHTCITSVIPGMFPLLFIGIALSSDLQNIRLPYLGKILRIPGHISGLFLVSLFCGYPTGGKLIYNAVKKGSLDKETGKRMMVFCNNASPAFIIGVLGVVFSNIWIAISLWLIQIATSLIIGVLFPQTYAKTNVTIPTAKINSGNALLEAIKAMSIICGWIIIFSVALSYLDGWTHNIQSDVSIVLLKGALEITNGILMLPNIRNLALRFILSSTLLSFSGICIFLQTYSVAPDLTTTSYVIGRLFHTAVSAILSTVLSLVIFSTDMHIMRCIPLLLCVVVLGFIMIYFNKKTVAIKKTM